MTIFSMTGFARAETFVSSEGTEFCGCWEIKSVNGKAMDVKFRMPSGFDETSLGLKNILNKYFFRGNFSVNLEWKGLHKDAELNLNDRWLAELTEKAVALYRQYPASIEKATAGELLALRGVIESEESSLSEKQMQDAAEALKNTFDELCRKLHKDRACEGEKIKQALLDILNKISIDVEAIAEIAETLPSDLKKRLEEQMKLWLAPENQPSEERLAQELVFYVTRADIKEEIIRLQAHVKTAQELLEEGGAVGRRLDFLCQELNREANTTCSKSCDIKLTNLGMELKALIEQFREQVQNIE